MTDLGRSPQAGRATHERSQSSLSPPAVSVPNAVEYEEIWEPMLFERPVGGTLEVWRQEVSKTELYRRGDTVLVWVNEGDLYCDGPFVKRLRRASAIEAATAGETPQSGSTEGKSVVPERQTPTTEGLRMDDTQIAKQFREAIEERIGKLPRADDRTEYAWGEFNALCELHGFVTKVGFVMKFEGDS